MDTLIRDKTAASRPKKSLNTYLIKLARLGGYLARAHDPPPGNKVVWRGLTRLIDIELGAIIGAQLVGNRKLIRTLTIRVCRRPVMLIVADGRQTTSQIVQIFAVTGYVRDAHSHGINKLSIISLWQGTCLVIT